MTEKRFVDYFDKDHNYIIQDLQNEDEYQVGFVNCDEDIFLELVNKIADENEQLKQQVAFLEEFIKTGVQYEYYQKIYEDNEQLKQLLDEAEDIIMCQCTPHYQRQWENIKKNLKR